MFFEAIVGGMILVGGSQQQGNFVSMMVCCLAGIDGSKNIPHNKFCVMFSKISIKIAIVQYYRGKK